MVDTGGRKKLMQTKAEAPGAARAAGWRFATTAAGRLIIRPWSIRCGRGPGSGTGGGAGGDKPLGQHTSARDSHADLSRRRRRLRVGGPSAEVRHRVPGRPVLEPQPHRPGPGQPRRQREEERAGLAQLAVLRQGSPARVGGAPPRRGQRPARRAGEELGVAGVLSVVCVMERSVSHTSGRCFSPLFDRLSRPQSASRFDRARCQHRSRPLGRPSALTLSAPSNRPY
jgi:hypothetical protein